MRFARSAFIFGIIPWTEVAYELGIPTHAASPMCADHAVHNVDEKSPILTLLREIPLVDYKAHRLSDALETA